MNARNLQEKQKTRTHQFRRSKQMTKGLFSLAVRLLRPAAAWRPLKAHHRVEYPSRGKSKFPVATDDRQTPISRISVMLCVVDLIRLLAAIISAAT